MKGKRVDIKFLVDKFEETRKNVQDMKFNVDKNDETKNKTDIIKCNVDKNEDTKKIIRVSEKFNTGLYGYCDSQEDEGEEDDSWKVEVPSVTLNQMSKAFKGLRGLD